MVYQNKNQDQDSNSQMSSPPQNKSWQRFIPIFVLVIGLCLILFLMRYYNLRLDQQFWVNMAARYDMINQWIDQNYAIMILAFIAGYTVAVAFSVPGAVFLTLIGGAFFGWLAVILVVFAASLGAVLVFLAARGALASFFQSSTSQFINRLKDGFDRSPFFWLLALRLMPVAPFWVVNIIPAMLGMRVLPYLAATVIGIIPGSAVFVYTGIGFGELMAIGQTPNISVLADQRFLGPIVALSVLALIPALIKSRRKASAKHTNHKGTTS